MTKDSDFVNLLTQKEKLPGLIWVTAGNNSTRKMKEILAELFEIACSWLEKGESLVG